MKFKYNLDIPEYLGTPDEWIQEQLRRMIKAYWTPDKDNLQFPVEMPFQVYPTQEWKEEDDAPADLLPKLKILCHYVDFKQPQWKVNYTPLYWYTSGV